MFKLFKCFNKSSHIKNIDIHDDNLNDYKKFDLNGIEGNFKVISVYDGDTIVIIVPIKMQLYNTNSKNELYPNLFPNDLINYKIRLRLIGIDTPEIKPLKNIKNREKHITKAEEARDYLASLIKDKIIHVKFSNNDKYGRPLAYCYINNSNLSDIMLDSKHAIPYNGGTKKNFLFN